MSLPLVESCILNGQRRLGGEGRDELGVSLGKRISILLGHTDQRSQNTLSAIEKGNDGSFNGDGQGGGNVRGRACQHIIVDDGFAMGEGPGAEAFFSRKRIVERGTKGPRAGLQEELSCLLPVLRNHGPAGVEEAAGTVTYPLQNSIDIQGAEDGAADLVKSC